MSHWSSPEMMKLHMLKDCRAQALRKLFLHRPPRSKMQALTRLKTITRHQKTKTRKAPGTRTPRHVLGTVRLRFLAPDGSANVARRIVVVVARWAQPVTLLELHGGAVHVVARLPSATPDRNCDFCKSGISSLPSATPACHRPASK